MFFTNINLELQQEQLLEDGSMSPHLFNSGIGDRGEDKYGESETIGQSKTSFEPKNHRSKRDKSDKPNQTGPPKGIHIQPIEFESFYWLEEFLDSLFQLKPSLKTSITYDKFRIVIEFFSGGNENMFDIQIIENVINHLKEYGCKVPVLIYSDIKINKMIKTYQRVMQLKKKYLMLFFTNDIKEVKKFCKMEHMRDDNYAINKESDNQ